MKTASCSGATTYWQCLKGFHRQNTVRLELKPTELLEYDRFELKIQFLQKQIDAVKAEQASYLRNLAGVSKEWQCGYSSARSKTGLGATFSGPLMGEPAWLRRATQKQ